MSYRDYVMVPRADWKGLCDAAREKQKSDKTYTSGELLEAVATITPVREVLGPLVDGSATEIVAEDLGNVATIRHSAFAGMTRLVSVEIPVSVTKIEGNAFYGCTGLTDVYYAASITEWAQIAIEDGNDPLLNANIHFAVESSDSGEIFVGAVSTAFRYCAHIDLLNFNNYGLGDAYRDDSGETPVIVTPVVDGYTAANFKVDDVVGVRAVLILSGWALVNGGQDKYYWSANGHTWREITRATYGAASEAQANAAMAKGLNSIHADNGTFKDAIIDLTAYRGLTMPTIYVAVRSKATAGEPIRKKLCRILTFTNCRVPS